MIIVVIFLNRKQLWKFKEGFINTCKEYDFKWLNDIKFIDWKEHEKQYLKRKSIVITKIIFRKIKIPPQI